jgi:S-methylmethionine-dependent homocysteine/selenocysteine methylase
VCGLPFGVYPNVGGPLDDPSDAAVVRNKEDFSPDDFAHRARAWLTAGARVIGGCCGTTPAHVARLAQMMRN